jgi:murein tripeptide amidase MpaA
MSVYAGLSYISSLYATCWPRTVPSESWFTAYHPYADHLQFLRDLQAGYTGQSEIVTVGTSVQGRALTGIHIWGSGGKGSKPAVVIHGNVHAREWITSMTTEYVSLHAISNSTMN